MPPDNELELTQEEQQEAQERSSVTVHVVHEAVRREGEEELKRTPTALAWSGLAAGLCMGFSLIVEGILHAKVPAAPWAPLLVKFGYAAGFLLVILGRQQLFTENTLTPMLPLFHRKDSETLFRVARLWCVVFLANMVGAVVIAWAIGNTELFPPDVRHSFDTLAREAVAPGFGLILWRGVFAGWLIAMLIWLLPFAETARFIVIVTMTWIIGIGGFSHVIAGSVDAFFLATTGVIPFTHAIGGFVIPALIGNVIGGVMLVAMLNHAQVVS